MQKVTIYLSGFQWEAFAAAMQKVFENAPIRDYECESCVIAQYYEKKMASFIYYKAKRKGKKIRMKFSFSQAEAFAINKLLTVQDEFYSTYIKLDMEPQLMVAARQVEFTAANLLEL